MKTPDPQSPKPDKKDLIFAPRRVLDDATLRIDPNAEKSEPKLGSRDIHEKAFAVLGFLEESVRAKQGTNKSERVQDLAVSKIDTIDAYLAQLNNPIADEQETLTPADGQSYEQLLESEIRELLSHAQVRTLLESEIRNELARYEKVEDKLIRLRSLRYAIKMATLDMHATYLRSKRENKGTLIESAGKKIQALSGIVQQAEAARATIDQKASSIEKGFIVTQELLRYKRQIQEKGFALTPSREKLLRSIVEQTMAGRKVFLVGSTGTGKTELAFYAVNEVTGSYEIIPWHEGTVPKDIFGQMHIAQGEDGKVESQFKPGPLTRGMIKGRGVIHEEITAGSTRTMMGMKPYMNLKPGQEFKIPEMNGTVLRVDEKFLEIFTGNPKSEQTKDREDLDPAILRMMKGIHVQYMPAQEMTKIVLATLMDESGLVKLSKSEIALIQQVASAAELMQQCHEGALTPEAQKELKDACGIDDLRITKNFLDPGTFLSLFSKWDYERRKGKTFRAYLAENIQEFINDPKNLSAPEERKILLAIFKLKQIAAPRSTENQILISQSKRVEKPYILPSELAFLNGEVSKINDDPLADPDNPDAEKDAKISEQQRQMLNLARGGQPNNPTISAINELTPSEKETIQTLIDGYDESVKIAREMDPTAQIKSKTEVLEALLQLGVPMLKEIAQFGRPTLLITPKNPFTQKTAAINANKKYEEQDDVFIWEDVKSPYTTVATPATVSISVVDGAQHMDHIDGIDPKSKFKERRELFKKHYQQKGMKLINPHEYAVLMQKSLHDYEQSGSDEASRDTSKIVDFDGSNTITCLDNELLSDSPRVACGCFVSGFRRVCFNAFSAGDTRANLRGRPSVQVM